MAILTKAQLQADNSASFADNNTQAITPLILRSYNGNIIDTLVDSLDTGSFAQTAVSNDFTAANQFTSISASSFISASAFVGDGSKLTGVTASVSLPISEEGVLLGNATQLNFSGSSITAVLSAGIATISVNTNNLITTSSFNSFTASTNTFTASQVTKDLTLATYTASVDTKFTAVGVSTASLNSFTSSQTTKDSTLATYTGSVNTSLSALNQFTASQSTASIITSITNLNTFSASTLTRLTNIESTTASLNTSVTNLNSFTSSQNTKDTTLASYTGSVDTKFTAVGSSTSSLNAFTASFTFNTASFVTTSSFQSYTSSTDTKFVSVGSSTSSLNTATASLFTSASLSLTTASVNVNIITFRKGDGTTFDIIVNTGSAQTTDITSLNSFTASQYVSNSYFATTGSNTFVGNQTITGNITAFSASFTYLQTIFESSSVIYSSGSNIFGDELSDTQTLSGSVKVQGSLTVNGTPVQTSSVDISALNSFTASQETKDTTLQTYTASVDTKFATIGGLTGSFATTGSNSFNGNQIITGSVYISSSATVDLRVEGQIFVSSSATGGTTAPKITVSGSQGTSTINRASITTRNTTDNGGIFPSTIFTGDIVTADEIGFTVDTSVFSITGWPTGSAIYINNTTDTYPAIFGFQNKATYTDGRVAVLTPLSASAGFTASLQNGYAWVGNSLGQNTQVATSSFGTAIDTGSFVTTASFNAYTASQSTGSFATTGSNTFNGNQLVKNGAIQAASYNETSSQFYGSVVFQGVGTASVAYDHFVNAGNFDSLHIESNLNAGTIFQDYNGSNVITWLSIPTNTGSNPSPVMTRGLQVTGSLNVSGSANFVGGDVNFTDQSRNVNIDVDRTIIKGQKPTLISSSLDISGSLTASLSNGYAWVGDATNHNVLVATSSFATNVSNLATTGSNTFRGNQNISGSLTVTGSAFGNVVSMSITSNTASMDLNLGNYFTLTLAGTATTHISASNVQPGVSATLVITTGTNSSASLAPTMLQPSGSSYSATNGSGKKDVLSIVAVASGVPFVVSTKNMI